MSSRPPVKKFGTSLSAPGLLALMAGLGLLYSYVAFQWSHQIDSTAYRVVLLGSAVLLALWGANEVVVGILQSFRGRRELRDRDWDEAARPPASRRLQMLSGMGLAIAGMALAFLMATRASLVFTVAAGLMIGLLLIVTGIRNVLAAMRSDSAHQRIIRRQALPLPGIVYLAMMSSFLIGSLIGRSNMLMLMFALMAGPFVLNGWMTFRMLKKLKVSRQVSRTVFAGESFDVTLTVSNGKSIMSSWMMDIADRVRGTGEEIQTGVLFTRIPPRESRHGSYRLRLMQRGRYRFGPISLTTRFPLGVAERGFVIDQPEEIIVYPRLGQLTAAWDREQLTATELVEKQNSHAGIYDDEFHRLREFRWGDNPRAIHWRTAARRNELMVREFHQSRDLDLTVLLDLWVPEKPDLDDWERVEIAVSFAATLCISHMKESRDSVITLCASGNMLKRWQGQAAPRAFDSLLETLALLVPGPSCSFEDLLEHAAVSPSASVRTLLISSRPNNETVSRDSHPVSGTAPVGLGTGVERYGASHEELSRYFELTPIAEPE